MLSDTLCGSISHGGCDFIPWDLDSLAAADGLDRQEKKFVTTLCKWSVS